MELSQSNTLVMIAAEDLEALKRGQQQIIDKLNQFKQVSQKANSCISNYITAKEFMEAVRIRRWKFDQLVAYNSFKTVRKKRKIYVLATEVERYFVDPCIQ